MGLIFNLTIILCIFLHSTSSVQAEIKAEVNRYDVIREIIKLNDKISFLMEQMKKLEEKSLKLEEKNSNLENALNYMKTNDIKLEQQLNGFNETFAIHSNKFKELRSQVDQRINWLNETVERVSNSTKINSNDIDSIGQCLNISINNCDKKYNALEQQNELIEQVTCNFTHPTQLYHLSPDTLVYTWRELNMSNTVQREDKVIESEVFSLDKHGINAQVEIQFGALGYINSFLHFRRKHRWDEWPSKVHPKLTHVMRVEREGQLINTYVESKDYKRFGDKLSYDMLTNVASFYYFQNKPKPIYEASETFSIEYHLETPEMTSQFYSDNGTVKGTICPYGKIKEWRSKNLVRYFFSPYFYTGPKGYKVVIEFEFYQENKLDVEFLLLKGPHDSLLRNFSNDKWKRTFTLINQSDPSKSLTLVKETEFYFKFLEFYQALNVSDFVINEQLMYEAAVEIIDN